MTSGVPYSRQYSICKRVRLLEQAALLRAVSLRGHHGLQRLHHRQGVQGIHVQVPVQQGQGQQDVNQVKI